MINQQNLTLYNHQALLWKKSNTIFLFILLMVISAIASLPFIETSISIKSTGIIRPQWERTDIKPSVGGIIECLLIKEGDTVLKGQLLAVIQNKSIAPKMLLNRFEKKQRLDFISDLTLLTDKVNMTTSLLKTPLYRQELNRFHFQYEEQEVDIMKMKKELEINSTLLSSKAIAPKEYFDKEIEVRKRLAAIEAFRLNQQASWQHDLQRYQLELSQLEAQEKELEAEKNLHKIYAPLGGTILNSQPQYEGRYIQPGEPLCTISPQTELIAECLLSTDKIGLLEKNQAVQFQIDAFDYNYFGILTGKVLSIDNDFSLVNNKPIFKVRCSFDHKQLFLKNGYRGLLKKGLTLQARFMVTKRTLWQLLFDKIDNWLNPSASSPIEHSIS